MGIRSALAKPFAACLHRQTKQWSSQPAASQEKVFKGLMREGSKTLFGKDHGFADVKNFQDFARQVPIRDYEEQKHYIEKALRGEPDIMWKGKPLYFAKTSGTTSGVKYIPLSKESVPEHVKAARNALLTYIHETGNTSFINGKMIFLQGSPVLSKKNGINVGRLSG